MRQTLLLQMLFVLLIPVWSQAVWAQDAATSEDSTLVDEAFEEYEERVYYGFFVDPFAVYSSTYGFGIRALATVYNLPLKGSMLRATVRPYQRRGVYALSLRTHDPRETDIFGLLKVRYETNGAYRYYGLGSTTAEDDRLLLDLDSFELDARIGFQFDQDRFLIEPMVKYNRSKVLGLNEGEDPSSLDVRSFDNLAIALGDQSSPSGITDNAITGIRVGLALQADFRDRAAYPTSGTLFQLAGMQFSATSDLDVGYTQLRADAHAFVGLGGSHVLAFRSRLITTDPTGEDPIPFYLLPKIDFSTIGGYKGHRMIDNDLIALTAEYRWSVVNLSDLYQVSGFVQSGIGNVFESISDMKLSVSFNRDLGPDDHVLRPGFGIGLRVSALEQGRDLVYWMLGFGPEGVTMATFKFVYPLTDIL